MTCQECEIKLGMGEDAAGHLASCAECRALDEDLRLNAVALREMRVRPRMHWVWRWRLPRRLFWRLGCGMGNHRRSCLKGRLPQNCRPHQDACGAGETCSKKAAAAGTSARENVHVRPGRGDLLDRR